MKKLITFFLMASLAFTIQAQNITNELGASGSFTVDKSGGATNFMTLSSTDDHILQLSASTKSFIINNSGGTPFFKLYDFYDVNDIGKLIIGHNDSDWLGGGNFANFQIQSTFNNSSAINIMQVGTGFPELAGYRAIAGPAVVTDNVGMLALYGYGYDGSAYSFSAGILLTTDGSYASEVPGKIEFKTATNAASPATRMTIKNDGKVGIGTTTPGSTLDVGGSVSKAVTINVGDTYTADADDYTIIPQNSSGDITLTLPAPGTCSGRIYVVKHDGNADNDINIGSSTTIDGHTTITLDTAWETVTFQSTGSTWIIIGGVGYVGS